jgi:hypothetical protein
MSDRTSWWKGPHYVIVEAHGVVVGDQTGGPFADACGTCSHDELLGGMMQDIIARDFGPDVLAEVVQVVRKIRGDG